MTTDTDRLLARIEDKRDELVALTRALVRVPTVNPPGDAYEACAHLLGERLAARGFAVEYPRAHGAPGDRDSHPRINMVARREGTAPGPGVHFNGHIDVVLPGSGWTVDPWEGAVRDGKVYGRGTCDMKGGIAASVIAVEAILDEGIRFPGALEISGTVDEESGGFAGVGWLAQRGYFSPPRVHHVIIPEPLGVDRICTGHRGVWWAEVETFGRIAHGSMPFLGDSAIDHMAAFVGALERDLQPRLRARCTCQPVEPPEARRSTLNLNSIHGGQSEPPASADGKTRDFLAQLPSPVVADSCRAVLDRRYLVEEDPAEVRGEIEAILQGLATDRPGFRYAVREVMAFEPTHTPEGAPVVEATRHAIRRVLGKEAQLIASPGTYDQKHIARSGNLRDCIAYGPGVLDLAHQPDEWVGIDALVQSAQVMALAALELLHAPGR